MKAFVFKVIINDSRERERECQNELASDDSEREQGEEVEGHQEILRQVARIFPSDTFNIE